MSCKTFCMLAAMAGIAWTVEAGEIVPAEIRCGVAYPLVINAVQPMDLNVLPVEPASVTFAQDARNIRITALQQHSVQRFRACWSGALTVNWKIPMQRALLRIMLRQNAMRTAIRAIPPMRFVFIGTHR